MGCPQPPALHPVAMHPHNNRLAPADETIAPVYEDMHAHADTRGKERGEGGHTAMTSTQRVQPKKDSPNKMLGQGSKWYSLVGKLDTDIEQYMNSR